MATEEQRAAPTSVPDRVPVETLRGETVMGTVVDVISQSAPAPREYVVEVEETGTTYRVASKDVGFI